MPKAAPWRQQFPVLHVHMIHHCRDGEKLTAYRALDELVIIAVVMSRHVCIGVGGALLPAHSFVTGALT